MSTHSGGGDSNTPGQTRSEERSAWIDDIVPVVDMLLLDSMTARWPNPLPALRTFFGRVPEKEADGSLDLGHEREHAVLNWLTLLRRPRAASDTVVEGLAEDVRLDPVFRMHLTDRAEATPTVWVTRMASADGTFVVEDAFTGEVQTVVPLVQDALAPPGHALPALLVPAGSFVRVLPMGPEMDESETQRAMRYLSSCGLDATLTTRRASAHIFGHLFDLLSSEPPRREAARSPGLGPERSAKTKRTSAKKKRKSKKPVRRKGAIVRDAMLDISVSLLDTQPAVRRRFLLRRDATFDDLHRAIQDAFGWTYSHLWDFREVRTRESLAGPRLEFDSGWMDEVPDASIVPMTRHLRAVGDFCKYTYDFGDCWRHRVKLLGGAAARDGLQRVLLSGAMTCPPEDCGGVSGYAHAKYLLETGVEPEESDGHDHDVLNWLGDWDPNSFDLEAAKDTFDS